MIQLCAFSDEAGSELKTQIEAMQRNRIFLTELRSVDGKNVSKFSVAEAKEIFRTLKSEGISVWSVGSPLGKCEIDITETDWQEQVKRICEIAGELGTDKVRAFSFFHAYRSEQRVFDYLNEASAIAKEYGVTLYHENEKEVFGDTCARVRQLMENLRDWKFIYDPANFVHVGEETAETLPLAMKCDYFHIKDVIAATGEMVPAGEGDGAVRELLQMIKKDTVLTVEPHLAAFSAYAMIDKSELKLRHQFKSNSQAFDTAVHAIKLLLDQGGWKETNGVYQQSVTK